MPASPGGAIDLLARLSGQKLTEAWGKPVVVENKAGATGTIGTDAVARAAPDGHLLALVASSHAINPSMFKKLPYDTVKSFEPVILTHVVPLMLVVNASVPVKNVKELIAYGKANPGQADVRFQRSRRRAAHVGRAVQEHGRHRHDARSLQGQHGRAPGPVERPGAASCSTRSRRSSRT